MQVVIDIDDKDYQLIKDGHIPFNVLDTIKNGTPLPKEHGRLIDADKIKKSMFAYMMDKRKTYEAKYVMSVARGIVDLQKTIIEADKGE